VSSASSGTHASSVVEAQVVEIAQRLINAPSPNPPGDEQAPAAVAVDALEELGLPRPRVVARAEHRPNLLTTLDFGPGGRHLCLCGHLDTKPIGTGRWSFPPDRATLDEDRLYGRGAVDMKGSIAAMIVAAHRLASAPPRAGRLTLLFTADEEDGAEWGAHYIAEHAAPDADAVVIGEPAGLAQDFDRLHLVSRGIARFRVDVTGDQGHSSLSDQTGAVNASVELARLLVALADGFVPEQPPNDDDLDGWTATVTAGLRLSGGIGYGVVPGLASFDAEIRLLPGMTRWMVERDLERFLAREQEANSRLRPLLRFDEPPRDWLPGTGVSREHPLASAARTAFRTVLGFVPPESVYPATTDAAWLHGLAGIPTLPAFGPGLLLRAHGADEYVDVPSLARSTELFTELARDYCGGSQ
jgi:acetylornithine deacetylase/succinyl-diaminopimelate desuccinylase-like protein